MKKHFLLILLSILLICTIMLFAGCDDTPDSTNENGDGTTQTPSGDDSNGDNTSEFSLSANLENCTIEGDNISIAVSNSTNSFSFINAFNIPENYKWELHYDKSCLPSLNVVSKSVDLDEGDNTLYALFINKSNSDEIYLYEILVHRTAYISVKVNTGVDTPKNYSCLEGTTIKELKIDIPTYDDRQFKKLQINGATVTEDYILTNSCTINVIYEMNKYTVNFIDENNNIIYQTVCEHGTYATFAGEMPPATYREDIIEQSYTTQGNVYEYNIIGWEGIDNKITDNTTLKAIYGLRNSYHYVIEVSHDSISGGLWMEGNAPQITITRGSGDIGTKLSEKGIGYFVKRVIITYQYLYKINSYAFLANEDGKTNTSNISQLEYINIPVNVWYIAPQAFYNCLNLKEIHYEGTISQWKQMTLANGWNNNSAIERIICSDGVIQL